MTSRSLPVSAQFEFGLLVPGSAPLPVRAELRYDAGDPYAMQVAFHTGPTPGTGDVVEWTFARELFSRGVDMRVGEGDVQVWPVESDGGRAVCLSLSSPSGQALFHMPLAGLQDFLRSTYDAVPAGTEGLYVDVEGELALLLWAEPET